MDGALVANSGTDFWDGTIANPINVTELGTTISALVFTGTNPDGSQPRNASRYFTFGPNNQLNLFVGNSAAADSTWVLLQGANQSELHNVYAVSSILTAVVANPPAVNAGIALTKSGIALNRTTNLWVQTDTLTNTTAAAIAMRASNGSLRISVPSTTAMIGFTYA